MSNEQKESKLINNILLYTIGNFGSKILVMIIVPIYTYFVSQEGIGFYDLVTTSVNLIVPIAMLSIQEGIYRWLLLHRENKNSIIKNGVIISFFGILVAMCIFIPIAGYFKLEYIGLIAGISVFQCVYTLLQEITRGLQHIKLFSLSGILYSVFFLISNVLFVCVLKMKTEGLLLSLLVTLILTSVFLVVTQKEISLVTFSKEKMHLDTGMIKYSILLIPNNVSWWLTSYSDRYMIRFMINPAANGIYAIATKFPSMLSMVTGIFYSAWQEQALLLYDSEERDEYYSKIFDYYSTGVLSVLLFLTPITRIFIVVTMAADFHSAIAYVGFLYLGCAIRAFSAFYGTGYLSAQKTGGAMTTTVVGAVVNIAINALFMGKYGLHVAGISTAVSYFVVWILRIFQTKKFFTIKLKISKLAGLFVLNLVLIIGTVNTGVMLDIVLCLISLVVIVLYNKELLKIALKKIKDRGRKIEA